MVIVERMVKKVVVGVLCFTSIFVFFHTCVQISTSFTKVHFVIVIDWKGSELIYTYSNFKKRRIIESVCI